MDSKAIGGVLEGCLIGITAAVLTSMIACLLLGVLIGHLTS